MPLPLFYTERGEPDRLRAEASELRVRAGVIRQVAQMLRMVSTKGVWDSGAGAAFAGEVGQCPQTLQRLADRLDEAAHVVGPYADVLEEAQQRMSIHRRDYEKYSDDCHRFKTVLAGMSPEDPQYPRVDSQWRDAANNREMARRRYRAEGEQAEHDAEVVARRLDAVADVGADPGAYDLFEGLRHLGTSESVALVGMVAKPVAVMAFADPIGRLGHKVVYDEGSWTEVGAAAKTALFGLVKLPKGIGATADDVARQRKLGAEVSAAKARHARPVGTSGSGLKRLRHTARTKVRQTTAVASVRAGYAAKDGLAKAAGMRLIDNMRADWAAIAGAGHVTKGVHVLKYSVAAADKVDSTRRSTQQAVDILTPRSRTHRESSSRS